MSPLRKCSKQYGVLINSIKERYKNIPKQNWQLKCKFLKKKDTLSFTAIVTQRAQHSKLNSTPKPSLSPKCCNVALRHVIIFATAILGVCGLRFEGSKGLKGLNPKPQTPNPKPDP